MALACAGAALVVWRDPPTARAENGPLPAACLTEAGGAPDSASPLVLLLPYSDPAGRFRLLRPCGWRQVTSLAPGSPVLASFYNPEEPGAETLAVYVGAAPELPELQRAVATTADLGSPEAVAARLASSAPNGHVIDAHAVSRGRRSYSVVQVQFEGNTAGMFGATREVRSVVVERGVQYTLRVTTTRYRYLAQPLVRQWIREVADSFELLAV